MLRILADFNAMTEDRKVWLNARLFKDLPDTIYPGLRVILYEPNDFEVEATIEVEKKADGTEVWYGNPDWATLRHLSNDENLK